MCFVPTVPPQRLRSRWCRFTLIIPGLFALAAAALDARAEPASPAQAAHALPPALQTLLDEHELSPAAISLLVHKPGEDEPRLQFQAGQPRNPASVMKLFTTYAALDALGPAHTWTTRVHADGPVEAGRLEGDLWIEGSGDPLLTAERFWELLGSVQRRGVDAITGDLVLDRSRFAPTESGAGAFDGRPYRAYNQPPHPLLVNYNAIQFELESVDAEGRVRVAFHPPLDGLEVDNRLQLDDDAWCNAYRWHVGFALDTERDPPTAILDGRHGSGCDLARLYRSALPVEDYVHDLFDSLWRQWGGEFDGGWRSGEWSGPEDEPLVEHESGPLSEAVRRINKYSNNVMTRQLALSLAAERADGPVTEADGRSAVRAILDEHGLDTAGMVLDEVAGLSRTNRVSAVQVADLLELAAASRFAPEFQASLPIAGIDGTLSSRFADSAATGRMRMKTGMLRDASTIAGYLRNHDDEDLIAVILINGNEVRGGRGHAVQEAILHWILEGGA